jgi:G protein-coupled receptor 107
MFTIELTIFNNFLLNKINLHYIAVNGKHEAVWAILFYITYVLRGLLMITSILLVGTGFNFVKHILSDNERRLFAIVVPLQVIFKCKNKFLIFKR